MTHKSTLAIFGGRGVRSEQFPLYSTIGKEEVERVTNVLKSGILSKFLGTWSEDFYGGPQVRAFENEWATYFNVKHAITVNSATSGLYAAVGALGIGPGDEVIVSPFTMSASAAAPLVYGGIPVFADIEEDYFCLSPDSVEKNITKYTKAIIIVDIFGQPYNVSKISALAKRYNLKVIEDCAQAPGAKYNSRFTGTFGDIGVYSLNYHKHIHTGEGGVIVTNNDELAERLRLIRNHAEAVLEKKKYSTLVNMVGFNYRMTEVEAAIGRGQLIKLSRLIKERLKNVNYLSKKLRTIPCLEPARIRKGCIHSFYVHAIKYKESMTGVPRDIFVKAVQAELDPKYRTTKFFLGMSTGYVKPLYFLPIYQKRIAFGKDGYPWNNSLYKGKVSYQKGICPIAERMHDKELILHDLIKPGYTKCDLDDIYKAFHKVYLHRTELMKQQ